MFKSCGSLFDLSRKLGSVVGGLGLAGVLFAGQVSATGGLGRTSDASECYWSSRVILPRLGEILPRADRRAPVHRNIPQFTPEEDAHIIRLVQEYSRNHQVINWRAIAESLGNGRTARQCRDRYNSYLSSPFTTEEDESLMGLVQEQSRNHLVIHWVPIARSFGNGETATQCRDRYNNYLEVSSSPFTPEEDESLMRIVQEHGERNWVRIAGLLGTGRKAAQCKVRYRHLLQHGDHVPIPQITTPITANGNQNAVNATDTPNADTQSR